MKKILIPIAILAGVAYLTRDKWMLPFINIKILADGKSFEYELFANGNTVKGVAPMNPDDSSVKIIDEQIGINEFKVYPPATDMSGGIKAVIYEDGKDDEIASLHYDIKTKIKTVYYEKSYVEYVKKYFPYISIASLIYMGVRLNVDMKKQALST